ncbi:hypothetical protein L2E82_29526 [Cichorium intybus]|uniref:Uncharacterized protein n=1 Tax=Cichorium intybus TaxID=13427 RepID=A0ACB9CY20_CICIN|nr:hypothetical protein L2E82_29526 [Cichorium intybus]
MSPASIVTHCCHHILHLHLHCNYLVQTLHYIGSDSNNTADSNNTVFRLNYEQKIASSTNQVSKDEK